MKTLLTYILLIVSPLLLYAEDIPNAGTTIIRNEIYPDTISRKFVDIIIRDRDYVSESNIKIHQTPTKFIEPKTHQQLAVKTNALLWATTVMNIEGEYFIHPHISTSLSIAWCPWFISDKFALRNLSILPEARWWLNTQATGHFFGFHLSLSWYNIKWGDYRYQDTNHPLLGAGITYGYFFRLSPQWGVELAIGAGYASMRYDRYHNVNNGQLIDTRKTSWFGIDRACISISYRFHI